MNIDDFNYLFNRGHVSVSNKTRQYIAPILNHHGPTFRKLLRQVSSVGVFCDDVLRTYNHCIYVMINIEKSKLKCSDYPAVMEKLTSGFGCVDYYTFDKLYRGNLLVIVYEIPDEYKRAFDIFTQFTKLNEEGEPLPVKYSKMYTKEQINKLFIKTYGVNDAVKVFRQDKEYRHQFEDSLNRIGVHAANNGNVQFITLLEDSELDYIPSPDREILNFNE